MRAAAGRQVGAVVIVWSALLYVALIVSSLWFGDTAAVSAWTVYLLYAVVGGLVLRHSARNAIGILVGVMGLVPLLGNVGEVMVAHGAAVGLMVDLAAWIVVWYFFVFLGAFLPLFHVFPSGTPLPKIWRWWYWTALLGSGLLVLTALFGPSDDGLYVNPFEIPIVTAIQPVVSVVVVVLMMIGLATGVISLGVRFRRARGREREQLKWFFFTVVVAVATFFGFMLLGGPIGWIPEGVAEATAGVAFALPAVGILIAMTRHGLYDIDRIVSRTVTYATVAVVVGAVYAFPVVLLPNVVGFSSDLAVAGSTLAAAVVFAPLRKRVQSVVARRFDRARYDAEQVVAAFSGRLQSAVDLGRVRDELGRAVGTALSPSGVSVWFVGQVS